MSNQFPSDLRKEYGAPFAIFSPEEGNRYTDLISRNYTPPRSLDFGLIQNPKLRKAVEAHCRTLGFDKIVKMNHGAYEELMLQFYTTLNFTDDRFSFRVNGKTATVKPLTLRCILGFPKGGHQTVPEDFDQAGFWTEISDSDCGGKKLSRLIKDPDLFIMHQCISGIFFGRDDDDSNDVTLNDLFYLSCLRRKGVRVDASCFMIANFKSVVTKKRAKMCLGNFITAIALYFGMFDPKGMKTLPTRALDLSTKDDDYSSLSSSSSISSDEAKGDTNDPVAIDDRFVDSWMLISGEMEKMQTRMNDGFNGLQAGFDGLEKKVESICARFQTLQREWADLRQRVTNESDKAAEINQMMIDKLLLTVEKIEEGWLAKISSLNAVDLANLVNDISNLGIGENLQVPPKNDSSGNRSVPDVDAHDHVHDDFPAVRSSNSNVANGRLSKNDDINSPETQTSCHNIPKPATDECKAARDIIEIPDSDDETLPNGEAETSKIVPNSDEINYLIQRNKRTRRNESMDNLFELSIERSLGGVGMSQVRQGPKPMICSTNDFKDYWLGSARLINKPGSSCFRSSFRHT